MCLFKDRLLFACLFQITWREPSARSEAYSPPVDGSDSRDKPKLYRLQLSVTEVGTEKFDDSSIQVCGRRAVPGRDCESGLTVGVDGMRAGQRACSRLRCERPSSSRSRALACLLFSGTRGCTYRVLQD